MTRTSQVTRVSSYELPPAGALLIASDASATMAENAILATGGRLLERVAWAEALTRFDRQGIVSVVLAEAIGVDDGVLVEVLPRLDLLARDGDIPVVVTLSTEQIDLVASSIAASGPILLCDPTIAERVVALCLAGGQSGYRVQDVAREAEASRLRRLHEEVARIAETLARLTRDDSVPRAEESLTHGVGEPGMSYRSQGADTALPDISAREIREAIRARRLRDQHFGAGLFEDPAWDMLLDLFAAELERAQVSVSSLCIAAAVAPTTALRWIARMTDAGLFERQPDPFDRRRAFMGLSRRASAGMRDYVAAVCRGKAGIA